MPSPALKATWGSDQWAPYVLDHLSVGSALLASGARRINITGKTANVPRLDTDGTASWTDELAAISSSAPGGSTIVLTPKKVANVLNVGNEAIEDVEADVLQTVGDAMARSVAVAIDAAAFSATAATTTTPGGLRSADFTLPGTSTTTADLAGVDAMLTGIGAIRTAGGKANAIYAAPADITALSLLAAGTALNSKLLLPNADGLFEVGGVPLYPTPAMPAGSALIAQSDQILVGIRRDLGIAISSDAAFTSDAVAIRITARVDIDVNDVKGLYLIA